MGAPVMLPVIVFGSLMDPYIDVEVLRVVICP